MSKKEKNVKKRKIDKTQIIIKVMALLLALMMILPIAISGIYALIG